jgi:glycosyltransferase involved in cell wall biosynthesis
MNILFLDQFTTIGGGQRSLLELLPLIRKRGWSARVALPGDGAFSTRIEASGVPVDLVRCGAYSQARKRMADFARYAWDLREMTRGIASLVGTHRINLLYVNGPRLLPAAALVARAKSIPLVFHCHHRLMQPVAVRLSGAALRWSRASMIACCRFAAEPLAAYVAGGRCSVVYNGVPAPAWTRRLPDPVKPLNIGVVGRVEPEKGHMEFVAAARIVSSKFPRCRFLVAGAPLFSGPEYLERVKCASSDLPFEFFGWQEDIGATFAELDLLVVPSSDIDSTPRVVMEAFSGGIPVVAFPAGGIPEIVEDRKTGFLASAASPEALAARIESVLLMGRRALREVTDRAQCIWKEKYTLDRFQQDVGDLIALASS